jgi:isochorismate hydrolase
MLRINGSRRDADELQVVFVADGNAALIDAEHKVTLNNMVTLFAVVMTTSELGFLDKAAAVHHAA